MCGIAGFISRGEPGRESSAVRAMIATLARRGPDGEGLHHWPGVAFGHRRLAIIDLSDAGKQPMLSDDGQIGVVFNGCIYNFEELRRELQAAGWVFRSRCDTEVLLRGYQEWGAREMATRLRGMFAFAVWDQRSRKLTLVRDRLGVKPLVYALSGTDLAFASTISALGAGGVTGEIDAAAVLEYLEFGFVTDARSIFQGIRKLPPATILEWQDGRASEYCYWSLDETDASAPVRFEEAVEQTEEKIVEAVRIRLCADVPIGALLSGGIDSALVCWALARLHANVTAFTVGTNRDASDEGEAARQTAAKLGIPHELVPWQEVGAPALEELLDAFSEPFACQSALGVLHLARAIKPKATVLLTGDGGDDVFLGYTFFYNVWRAQRIALRLPHWAPHAWRAIRPLAAFAAGRRAGNFGDYVVGGLGAYNRVRQGLPYFEERDMLGERLREIRLEQREIPASFPRARGLLNDVFAYHRKTHFLSEFMPKVDGGTMYWGLEARAPFLDHPLWEYAASLPPEVRFHGGSLKAVLREIVARRIGPTVAARGKQGFTIPVEKWLQTDGRDWLDVLRSGTHLESEGWIRHGSLASEIDRFGKAAAHPLPLWYLLVLEKWLQKQRELQVRPAPITTGVA
jgi:asparagine synthase (glutamine-hydrolysing)